MHGRLQLATLGASSLVLWVVFGSCWSVLFNFFTIGLSGVCSVGLSFSGEVVLWLWFTPVCWQGLRACG